MSTRAAAWVHYATLAAAAVVLVRVNRGMWFLLDEWAFIVDRSVIGGDGANGLLTPHNEHWTSMATLGYRGLFELFGVRTYMPYLAMMIVAHLLAAHLLWRLIRRVAHEPWVATAGATVFLFLGLGWENLTRAFQVSLIGSLAMGLLWLLVMPVSSRFERRDLLGWGIGVLGLTFSGVGVAMVAMAALYALLLRGWRMAAAVASVPAAVYLAWLVAYGRHSFGSTSPPLGQGLRILPAYVWEGLTGSIDATTGLAGAGVVVVLALGAWVVRRGPWPVDARWALAVATAAGAVAQVGFTAIRRSQSGVVTASESRYAYLIVGLMIPLVCLAVDSLLPRRRLLVAVAVGTAALLFVQLPILRDRSREWTAIAGNGRGVFVATVELARAGEPLISPTPFPWYAPDVQTEELVELADAGDLPLDVVPTDDQVLTARTFTQLRGEPLAGDGRELPTDPDGSPRVVGTSAVSWTDAGEGCLNFTPAGTDPLVQLSPGGPVELAVTSDLAGSLGAMFVARDGPSAAVWAASFPIGPGRWLGIESVAEGPDLRLSLPAGVTTVCGVAPPEA